MTGMYMAPGPRQYNKLCLSGSYIIKLRRFPHGPLIAFSEDKNLVTAAAETLTAALLDFNGVEVAPEYIAFGSGTTGAQKTDTQLQTEIASTRVSADSSTQANNVLQLDWSITAGATYTIQEMGVFNASVAGTMFSRFLTQPLSVESGDVIDITWILTISGVD